MEFPGFDGSIRPLHVFDNCVRLFWACRVHQLAARIRSKPGSYCLDAMTMMMITRSVNPSHTDLCLALRARVQGSWSRSLFGEMFVPLGMKLGLLLSDRKLPVVERHLSLAFWAPWGHDPLIITSQPFVPSSVLNRTTLWQARRTAMPPRGLYRWYSVGAGAQPARFSTASAKTEARGSQKKKDTKKKKKKSGAATLLCGAPH